MFASLDLAMNIKNIITQSGCKQFIIAERAGFNQYEFSNMLNGRKIIKAEDIPRIAKALGVTPNDLFNPKTSKPTG